MRKTVKETAVSWPHVQSITQNQQIHLQQLQNELMSRSIEEPKFSLYEACQQVIFQNPPQRVSNQTGHTTPSDPEYAQQINNNNIPVVGFVKYLTHEFESQENTLEFQPPSTTTTPQEYFLNNNNNMMQTPISPLPSPSSPMQISSIPSTPHDPMVTVQRIGQASPQQISSQRMNTQFPVTLSPLSSGGYIYNNFPSSPGSSSSVPSSPQMNGLSIPSTPESPAIPPAPTLPESFSFMSSAPGINWTCSPASPSIASRQEKLEKYRQKRSKRNWGRERSDLVRKERAQSRTRDENGKFVAEMKPANETELFDQTDVLNQLMKSKRESQELREKLGLVLKQMLTLRQQAEEENKAKEAIRLELEQQRQMNQALLQENRFLWSSVPINEIFTTITKPNATNPVPPNNFVNVDAFKEKIDLSNIELNWTDSPLLQAARVEDGEFEKRWSDMTFIAGQIPRSLIENTLQQQQTNQSNSS